MALFNRRGRVHHILCLLLVSLTLCGPATPLAAQQATRKTPRPPAAAAPAPAKTPVAKPDLTYVVPNASVLALYRPAQFLKSPMAEMFPIEILQAAVVQETGFDPLKVEQVVLSLSPPASFSAFVRFSEAVQLKEGELTKHTEPGTLHGKAYRKSDDPQAPSLYMPDDRTLIAAPDADLQQLTAGKREPAGPLADMLTAADQGDDLLYVVDVAALRPLIKQAVATADLPPEATPFLKAIDLVKSVTMRQNYSHPAPSELVATANNAEDAGLLIELFEDAKKIIAAQAAAESGRMKASEDPIEQAMGKYVDRMIAKVDALLKLQVATRIVSAGEHRSAVRRDRPHATAVADRPLVPRPAAPLRPSAPDKPPFAAADRARRGTIRPAPNTLRVDRCAGGKEDAGTRPHVSNDRWPDFPLHVPASKTSRRAPTASRLTTKQSPKKSPPTGFYRNAGEVGLAS